MQSSVVNDHALCDLFLTPPDYNGRAPYTTQFSDFKFMPHAYADHDHMS